MSIYAGVDENDIVVVQAGFADPEGMVGPPTPPPNGPYTYYLIPERIAGRPEGHNLKWNGGSTVWVDARVLAEELAAALAKPYTDIDAVVWDAVGGRVKEYEKAEAEARSFAESGYAEPAPRSIAKFAEKNPTMQVQTPAWAAQQIIGRADALTAAQEDMRDQRFDSQWDMRAATTPVELDLAIAAWDAFISQVRTRLGLPQVGN